MFLYRLISVLLFPLLLCYILLRLLQGKEDKNHLLERFGFASVSRPKGRVFWLHAVSVGETNSALIFVEELIKNYADVTIVFTTTTITSATILKSKLTNYQGKVIHQFLPIDSYFTAKNFTQFWCFDKAFIMESEIWPNLIYEVKKTKTKLFLVNARMSQKSCEKWQLARRWGFNIFDKFDTIFVQSFADEKRFSQLTTQQVYCFGNLKSQAQNLLCNDSELQELKLQIGQRNFWLAASTHKGEEQIILEIHQKLKINFPNLLTILVPRHPNRASEIIDLIDGIKFSQRSKKQQITQEVEIYLADTLGELGTFYTLADFVFIGGSMLEIGGHNPFEAAKLKCAVISGKNVFNFAEIYQELIAKNACVIVNSNSELLEKVTEFLTKKSIVEEISNNAFNCVSLYGNIAEKIIAKITQQ